MPAPILIVSGTNRPSSNAMKIARIVHGHYRAARVTAEVFGLDELPPEVFAPAAYAKKPPGMVAIQQRVVEASGLHVVTPEYNGSFPGILKYFIDMLKFPESFDRKPVAFVGEAAGTWGALRAVEQLQHVFGYRHAHIFPERVFIPAVNDKLDSDGHLKDADIDARLNRQVQQFGEFVRRLAPIA